MIGDLRHRVTFRKTVIQKDEIGQELEVMEDVVRTWAKIEPLSGREYFIARQINSEVTTKITIRYQKHITPDMLVTFKDQTYEILTIINKEERCVYVELLCTLKLDLKEDV